MSIKARFSVVARIVSEIKFNPDRGRGDFTIQVYGGRDRFHVTSVTQDDLAMLVTARQSPLGIIGYFVDVGHVALMPVSFFVLESDTDIEKFDTFVSKAWMKNYLLSDAGNLS